MKYSVLLPVWILCLLTTLLPETVTGASVDRTLVPPYVERGLKTYGSEGYEAAVRVWLEDSPYESATTLASNIALFKNIEKLAGPFVSYDYLLTRQTASSNAVYVRLNYQRLPGYVLFLSSPRNGKWVLTRIRLDRRQQMGGL